MCFVEQIVSLRVHVPPQFSTKTRQGIYELLQSLCYTYQPFLKAIPISFSNVQCPSTLIFHSDNPYLHGFVSASFITFKPIVGSTLFCTISRISEDHISGICFQSAVVTISAKDLHKAGFAYEQEKWSKENTTFGIQDRFLFTINSIDILEKRLAFYGQPA